MRLLVPGGAGMLSHKLWQVAGRQIDTMATVRRVMPALLALGLGDPRTTVEGVDARVPRTIDAALDRVRPDAVVNRIGIVNSGRRRKTPWRAFLSMLCTRSCSHAPASSGASG